MANKKRSDFSKVVSQNFGAGVSFTTFYRRRHEYSQTNGPNRVWEKRAMRPRQRQGILIGLRYLRNGRVTWYSDHPEWYPMQPPIPAYKVVFDPYRDPVYVPVDDLVILDQAPAQKTERNF